MYATARWLRSAFSELAWEIHDAVQDDDLVVVHATMSGRQTGPFVAYGPDGAVTAVFPPLGRRFATTQTHWFRMRDGKVAEHWANRDDLGMGQQLGWTPPTPPYIARMLLARRRMRRVKPQRGLLVMTQVVPVEPHVGDSVQAVKDNPDPLVRGERAGTRRIHRGTTSRRALRSSARISHCVRSKGARCVALARSGAVTQTRATIAG